MIAKILRPFFSAFWGWKMYLKNKEPKWVYDHTINGGFIAYEFVQKTDFELMTVICKSIIHD